MAKTGRHMQGSGVGRKKAAESNTPIKVGKAATLWHRRESWKLDGGKRRWKEFLFLSHIENCQSLAKGQLECELNCHMSHSTDFAKTTIQGYSEQRMRFLHLYQLWRCSTKFKRYTRLRRQFTQYSDPVFPSSYGKVHTMSSPDQMEEALSAPLSQCRGTAGSTVTAESDFRSRAKMVSNWSNGKFPILLHPNPQKPYCLNMNRTKSSQFLS